MGTHDGSIPKLNIEELMASIVEHLETKLITILTPINTFMHGVLFRQEPIFCYFHHIIIFIIFLI